MTVQRLDRHDLHLGRQTRNTDAIIETSTNNASNDSAVTNCITLEGR